MTDMTAETPAMSARHYSAAGAARAEQFALPGEIFDGIVNEDVLHQAVKVYLANQRQGTHKVKTRREVSGGGRKPYKQKGTGNARQGSNRAPHWRGGGIAFGPSPRDYRTDIPKKVRQLARRSALNARAREGMLSVIDPIGMTAPKTQALVGLLGKLAPAGTKVLVLTAGVKPALYLSARNVPHLEVMNFSDASAYDILHATVVVIESTALGAEAAATPEAVPAPKKPRAKKAAAPAEGETPAPKKPRAKKASE